MEQRSALVSAGGAALGQAVYRSYYNTGRLKDIYQNGAEARVDINSLHGGAETFSYRGTTFEYDAIGNVVSQQLKEIGVYQENDYLDGEGFWVTPNPVSFTRLLSRQTATFDALGRILSWEELGTSGDPTSDVDVFAPASHVFAYDANGNIRRSLAVYRALDSQGGAATTTTTQDYWYRYDAMDRMLTSKGQLVSGQVARGTTGVDTVYDGAGNRAYTLEAISGGGVRREDYSYNALNLVTQVNSGTNASAVGLKRADFAYDAMSRVTLQRDYDDNETTIVYSRAVTYNSKGQISAETTTTKRSGTVYTAASTYDYGSIGAGTYALGAAVVIDTDNSGGGSAKDTKTTNTYDWWDGAVQSTVTHDKDITQSGTDNLSTFYYDAIGGASQLARVHIQDGRTRTVYYTADMLGQVVRRDEKDGLTGGDPHEVWYRFSGRQMGYVGNNGTIDTSYRDAINKRIAAPGSGAFFNGASSSTSFADFDLAYDAINSYEQGSRGGMYTVSSGDTLSGIASALWGDASLWYKIAEVNGLTGESVLVEGQPLIVPAGVVQNVNNASTFQWRPLH